jgi:hypothetical protein
MARRKRIQCRVWPAEPRGNRDGVAEFGKDLAAPRIRNTLGSFDD